MNTKIFTKIALVILFTFSFSFLTFGQTPEMFKYQAVLRDASGNIIANQNKTVVIDILQTSPSGTSVFTESHSVTTTAQGLINLNIGSENSLSGIDWTADEYFIQITVDGTIMGTSQLLSVPYALTAKTVETVDYSQITNTPTIPPAADGSETKLTAGTNVTITGSGTTASPYLINASSGSGSTTHYVGELYGGGVVFWVSPDGQHGLIVSMADVSSSKQWCDIYNSSGIATSDWDGNSNTTAIISQSGNIAGAAKSCSDYVNVDYGSGIFDDWYLPSIDELIKIYNARYEIDKSLETDDNPATTKLIKNRYWSSSDTNTNRAYNLSFFSGEEWYEDKTTWLAVRAVRAF